MQLDRRAFVASAGALAATTIAGCNQITDDEPLEFESTPARVSDSTLEETGYEVAEADEIEIERSFDVAGQERTVTVTNQQVTYEKGFGPESDLPDDLSDDLPGAVFATLTTPSIGIVGREMNPVAEASNEELLERFQDQFGGIEDVEVDGEETVTVLGETTTRTRFAAEARMGGADVDVYIHVSNPVESADEFVAGVGVHPQLLPNEESDVVAMMEEIRHGE